MKTSKCPTSDLDWFQCEVSEMPIAGSCCRELEQKDAHGCIPGVARKPSVIRYYAVHGRPDTSQDSYNGEKQARLNDMVECLKGIFQISNRASSKLLGNGVMISNYFVQLQVEVELNKGHDSLTLWLQDRVAFIALRSKRKARVWWGSHLSCSETPGGRTMTDSGDSTSTR